MPRRAVASKGIARNSWANRAQRKAILNQLANFGACGLILPKLHDCDAGLTRKRYVWSTAKTAFPVLGQTLPRALAQWDHHGDGLALPNFVEGGNFSLNKLVIWWVSV
jgi:hypothetical protein